jgi:hypothetical protein
MPNTVYFDQINPGLIEEVLLIGGPVHGRRTRLSRQQVREGYEFVDASAGGRNYGGQSPHGTWRSNKYKLFTTINDLHLMVHGSVTEPEAWRLRNKLTEAKEDLKSAHDQTDHVRRQLQWEQTEKKALEAKLEKTRKFNRLARELLEEADNG